MADRTSDLLWQSSSAPQHGTVGDVNTMLIDPSYLGMAQDVIIDQNGTLRSRGGFKSITSDTFTNQTIAGMVQTGLGTGINLYDTTGHHFFYGTSAAALTGFGKLTVAAYHATPTTQELFPTSTLAGMSYSYAKAINDNGSVLCSRFPGPSSSTSVGTFMWGGNSTTTSDTSAGTAASTRGSKAIAGVGTAWTTALVNTYLFINSIYVGQVDQVTSTTVIALKKGAIATVAANTPVFKCVRPVTYLIYKGLITTQTASAVVVGSNTKFVSSGPLGGGGPFLTGDVFRYSDGAFVGTISSVQNDTTLTLGANAAIAMVNEEYYIVKSFPGAGSGNLGTNLFYAGCVEQFADRYWFGSINCPDFVVSGASGWIQNANFVYSGPNAIAFSKKKEPEFLDLGPSSGDILILPTGANPDSIQGMLATRGGLVVFRMFDTFLITGYSPETFRAIKILDDGAATGAFRAYKNGVVWAGLRSIWYFDGTGVVDLLANTVQRFYQRSYKNPNSNKIPGMGVIGDNLLFSYGMSGSTDLTWPYKNTTKSIAFVTMVINLLSGAVSFFTNLAVTGSFYASGLNPIIVSRTALGFGSGSSFLIDGGNVFQESTTGSDNFDAITGIATFSSGAQIGPDVMFETTKLTMGDGSRLKFWKRYLMNYSSSVGMTATFIGTNDTTLDFPNTSTGTASTDVIAVSSNIGILHRMRFLVRSATLSIRVYQTSTTSATSQRFKCLWWSVGGKMMRRGRAQP